MKKIFAENVKCPKCGRKRGEPCRVLNSLTMNTFQPHPERMRKAKGLAEREKVNVQ